MSQGIICIMRQCWRLFTHRQLCDEKDVDANMETSLCYERQNKKWSHPYNTICIPNFHCIMRIYLRRAVRYKTCKYVYYLSPYHSAFNDRISSTIIQDPALNEACVSSAYCVPRPCWNPWSGINAFMTSIQCLTKRCQPVQKLSGVTRNACRLTYVVSSEDFNHNADLDKIWQGSKRPPATTV
jgi:hypothetical protein